MTEVGGTTITVVEGDLTVQQVDAVVNAANIHLQHGGGVAAAIVRAGGTTIQRESDAWIDEHGPIGDGRVAITTGGDLPAAHVIHTAGPVYEPRSDDNERQLRAAVRGALAAADELGATSLAFPAISAGIYGYPPDEATAVLADEVVTYLRDHGSALTEIRLVAIDTATAEQFRAGLAAATRG
jgi:O-acetyl-ADP-ribose deacetylase